MLISESRDDDRLEKMLNSEGVEGVALGKAGRFHVMQHLAKGLAVFVLAPA